MSSKRKNSSSLDSMEEGKKFKDDPPADDIEPHYSQFARRMMSRMGHKKGKGLGKNETGRLNIVEASNQRGRRGLGLTLDGLDAKPDASWDVEEKIMIKQEPDWIPKHGLDIPSLDELEGWVGISTRKEVITDEYDFCEPEILDGIIKSKNIFDKLGKKEFLHSRTRANPYETIRGGIFQNRAAMKMAEIDASFDFMFTKHRDLDKNDPIKLLYFADICAGPGGFSEYVLWRTKWRGKGFGMTIKAEWANDFNLSDYIAGTPETFDCHYGEHGYNGDGDIFQESNLTAFRDYVVDNSDDKGVHFVMADGGFSVEGQENIQEILSKQLYLCQFLCALSVLRPGGHFVCKVFDLFTPFSLGLVYLMYRVFEEVCIFKPVTSRPANSERYFVCKSLREASFPVHDYMFNINTQLNNLKGGKSDVNIVVPVAILKDSLPFFEYMYNANNTIGAQQILALQKLATFVRNTNLSGPNQAEVRKQCFLAWDVPLEARYSPPKNNPEVQFDKLFNTKPTDWMATAAVALDYSVMKKIKSPHDYKITFVGGDRFYLFSLGRHSIFQWDPSKYSTPTWSRVDKIYLELPRLTLIDVELVNEYKGNGHGQRKMLAVHILDVMYLGADYVGDKPFSQRLKYAEMFVQALSKPCRNNLTELRVKNYYSFDELNNVFELMTVKQMKVRSGDKMSLRVTDDKYFIPTRLQFVRRVHEPWHLQHSRSANKLYFYNATTNCSTFEGVSESVAGFEYCSQNRLVWVWHGNMGAQVVGVSKDELCGFVEELLSS